jgi:hypothetical protein
MATVCAKAGQVRQHLSRRSTGLGLQSPDTPTGASINHVIRANPYRNLKRWPHPHIKQLYVYSSTLVCKTVSTIRRNQHWTRFSRVTDQALIQQLPAAAAACAPDAHTDGRHATTHHTHKDNTACRRTKSERRARCHTQPHALCTSLSSRSALCARPDQCCSIFGLTRAWRTPKPLDASEEVLVFVRSRFGSVAVPVCIPIINMQDMNCMLLAMSDRQTRQWVSGGGTSAAIMAIELWADIWCHTVCWSGTRTCLLTRQARYYNILM